MNNLIVQATDWKDEFGEAGKNFLDVYNDGVRFEYFKQLGYQSMKDCTRAISIEYGWSKSVAAALAVEALPELEVAAKKRQIRKPIDSVPPKVAEQNESVDIAGQMFGVGKQYVKDANNLKNDNPLLFAQVKSGDVGLQQAKREQKTLTLKTMHGAKNWYTISDWKKLDDNAKIMPLSKNGNSTFNTTNDNIEWARYSWNPVTGCLHNCDYCYARDIAARFFSQGFEPSFIPDRLTAPQNTKQKDLTQFDNSVDKIGYKNVFVCSMADLFGKWVPTEWIEAVLKQVKDNSQWTFLFLTKFPIRMAEFEYPENTWLGTTVDYQHTVERAEKAFIKIKASGYKGICWLSCEPMMERLTFNNLNIFDWVIMGGSSRSTQTPEYKPPFNDIVHFYNQTRQSNCQVYFKTNLLGDRIREYPNT